MDLLVSVLRRLYSAERASSWAWGVKVEEIVRMALRGSIESEVPVTLADLERFLLDPRYRKEALATAGSEATNYFLHRFGPQEQDRAQQEGNGFHAFAFRGRGFAPARAATAKALCAQTARISVSSRTSTGSSQ